MRLRTASWRLVAAAGLGLSACSAPGPDATESPESRSAAQSAPAVVDDRASAGPVDLVGTWVVATASAADSVTLQLRDEQLTISRACGEQQGEWRAGVTGMFIASISSWEPGCTDGSTAPTWLSDARFFAIKDDGAALLDIHGGVTATLSADEDAVPIDPPTSGLAPNSAQERLNAGRELPAALEPATFDRLVGRWLPARGDGESAPTEPFAELHADGSWTGSDGCNGQGGRWTADDTGRILATHGPQTLIGCNPMVDVGSWLTSAALAGFDRGVLVLVGPDGRETGRMSPA